MIHYHGTPLGGTRESVARFVSSGTRHFLVPFMRQEDLPVVAEASCGFCLDNGAFSAWKSGKPITDWEPYYRWVSQWALHPRFAFAIIPDKSAHYIRTREETVIPIGSTNSLPLRMI